MIERIVLLKLVDHLCNDRGRNEVAAYSGDVLSSIAAVLSCEVSIAADEKTYGSWDVCLKVRFADLDDYAVYATDEVHRNFLDDYLPSRITFKKAWNFSLGS